jgi:hypothetical protein
MTLIFLLATAAAQLVASDTSDAKPYISKDGKFSVAFPGKPDATTNTVKTPDGDMDVHVFRLTGKDKGVYSVVYTDYPADKVKGANPEKLLDQARDGGGDATRAKVKETKPKGLDYPARDLEVEIAGATSFSRLVLAKTRLYVVMAAPDGSKASTDAAKKFIESFKVMEK